jgi:ribosomal protein S18 acetylase RimI-like enzyme
MLSTGDRFLIGGSSMVGIFQITRFTHIPQMNVRRINADDVQSVATVHRETFTRHKDSKEWIHCNFDAYPRIQIFAAEVDGDIKGFIMWTQRSGFRENSVLELEQIAVHPEHQGEGIGTRLIEESLPVVEGWLAERDSTIETIIVGTRTDNEAQRLYKKALNAEPAAIIEDYASGNELFLVSRR